MNPSINHGSVSATRWRGARLAWTFALVGLWGGCSGTPTQPSAQEVDAVADAPNPELDTAASDAVAGSDADVASDTVDVAADAKVDGGWEPLNGCYSCHGTVDNGNPAPPIGTGGEIATDQLAVGAHQQHLAVSAWHRQVQCEDCHVVPTKNKHDNGVIDFAWSGVAAAMASSPTFDEGTATCSGAYCHGGALPGTGTAKTKPVWTQVDGTFNSCGASCHMTPPGGAHPQNNNCAQCHDAVITTFDPATQTATWKNAALHVNGQIDVKNLACTTCHGNPATNDPAPPLGTKGETQTTQLAVGAHQQHLATSGWHRQVACTDCHAVPTSATHSNGTVDFLWSAVATAMSSAPSFNTGTATCSGAYCHGGTLPGTGTAKTKPVWTQVDGTFNSCGASCHMTPPGGSHPQNANCGTCHAAVVAGGDPVAGSVTWANFALHVDGVVESNKYHALAGWTAPKFEANGAANPNHHGFGHFLANHGIDNKGVACTECHGANLDGGVVAVSCNNATINCHGANPASGTNGDWHACNFCHGGATQNNPPTGVANEATKAALAVGRHPAHLTASATHTAMDCTACHNVPPGGDIAHTQQYVPSTDLSTPGHHGDVTLPPAPVAVNSTGSMAWNVAAVLGNPVSERGSCMGACHSDGRGGAPAVTPYWAGGNWSAGNCGNCHAASPNTGHHGDHASGENNVYCTSCHPAADASSHVNGLRDVLTAITGAPYTGSITSTRPTTGNCANSVQCNGSCHGENHSNYCW